MISVALAIFIVFIIYIMIWSIQNDGLRSIGEQKGLIRMRDPAKVEPKGPKAGILRNSKAAETPAAETPPADAPVPERTSAAPPARATSSRLRRPAGKPPQRPPRRR